MRIFGRNSSGPYDKLGLICEELLTEVRFGANDRGFAWNLVHDGRVNPDWAEYWYREYGAPVSPGGLRTSLNAYQNDLRERTLSIYAELESRGRNFVRTNTPGGPAENDLLVHVLDLWSIGARRIWNHARQREMPILAEAADLGLERRTPPPIIADALESGTIDGQRAIMSTFFLALEDYLEAVEDARRRHASMATLNPYWVSLWEPWNKRVGGSGDDWCESVGLSKSAGQTPAWIAVLRYPVRRAHRLICPTQLEAHWYGRHFPTPAGCRLHLGGRVVEGRPSVFSNPAHSALREYIHAPIALYVTDWLGAGFPVLRTIGPTGRENQLERDRAAHWRALVREFPDTEGWMAEPNGRNIPLAI
jgi:hypothetical protein